jgi:hypothetical protein
VTLAALVLLLAPRAAAQAPAQAPAESAWPTSQTAHFTIHHPGPAESLGDYALIERTYEALHPSLWTLVPWMATEKTHVYLYDGPDSYRKGKFHPPGWSGGLFATSEGERAIAVYQPLDASVVAHELSHLYLHSYFDEKAASPPAWLDEGLAGVLQQDALGLPDPRDKGPIVRSPESFSLLLAKRPGADAPQAWVGGWYRQAASVVWFLKRGKLEASFVDLCGKLRDGEDAPAALREAYGWADVAAFEKDWSDWRPRKPPGKVVDLSDH